MSVFSVMELRVLIQAAVDYTSSVWCIYIATDRNTSDCGTATAAQRLNGDDRTTS